MSGSERSMKPKQPIKLFLSYSRADERMREKLVKHLASLEGRIKVWHDRKIRPGDDWEGEIDHHLDSADIILLLVSSDFVASAYCRKEQARALERRKATGVPVIAVILHSVVLTDTPLAGIQGLPTDWKPIEKWEPIDDGYVDVVKGIISVLDKIEKKPLAVPASPEHVDTRLLGVHVVQLAVSQLFRITDFLIGSRKVRATEFREAVTDPKAIRNVLNPERLRRRKWQRALALGTLGSLKPAAFWSECSPDPQRRFWSVGLDGLREPTAGLPRFIPFELYLQDHLAALECQPEAVWVGVFEDVAGKLVNRQVAGRLRIYPPGVGVIHLTITLTFREDVTVDAAWLAQIAHDVGKLLFVDPNGVGRPCEDLLLDIIEQVAAYLFAEEDRPSGNTLRWSPPVTSFSFRDDRGWEPGASVDALADLMSRVSRREDEDLSVFRGRIHEALSSPHWLEDHLLAVAGRGVVLSFATGNERKRNLRWLAETQELVFASAYAESAFVEKIEEISAPRLLDREWAPGSNNFKYLITLLVETKKVLQAISAIRTHLHRNQCGALMSFAKKLWTYENTISQSNLERGLAYIQERLVAWKNSPSYRHFDRHLSDLQGCIEDILAIRLFR